MLVWTEKVFVLTARFAGLEAVCETGTLFGGPHEWNRVRVDGEWCILDITNNDSDFVINTLMNVTDEQVNNMLVSDHASLIDYRDSTNSNAEYYYRNGMAVNNLDEKFAIKIEETLTRTVIVEADNYLTARDLVQDAYDKEKLQLHADNSAIDLEVSDDTDNYIEMVGKEEFYEMEIEGELK